MESARNLLRLLTSEAGPTDVQFEKQATGAFIEALRHDYPTSSTHPTAHTSFTWSDIAALLAIHKLFWLSIPIAALDPNTLDIRPHARAMATTLFKTPTDKDIRMAHVVLKRIRRYVAFGRPNYSVSQKEFLQILHTQNRRCNTCGHYFSDAEITAREYLQEPNALEQIGNLRPPQVDHIVPIFLAGHHLGNCQILCTTCNSSKGPSVFWPIKPAIIGPLRPSDVFQSTKNQKWMILLRDGQCTICNQPPTTLKENNELDIFKADPTRGWLLENSTAVCLNCAARIGLKNDRSIDSDA